MNSKKIGFTLVELVISISILVILTGVAFLGYKGYSRDSRDTVRISQVAEIKANLNLYREKNRVYPDVENLTSQLVANGGDILSYRGEISAKTYQLLSATKNVSDPLNNASFAYGLTVNKKEFQVGTVLENKTTFLSQEIYAKDNIASFVDGNYDGKIEFLTGGIQYTANVPSLIYNYSGSLNANKTLDIETNKNQIYYVTNTSKNLTYSLKNHSNVNQESISASLDFYIPFSFDIATLSDEGLKKIFETGKSDYTKNWSGSTCNASSMNVVDFYNTFSGSITKSGNDYTVPTSFSLSSNTIYKFPEGNIIFTGSELNAGMGVSNKNCIGVIGKGIDKTFFKNTLSDGDGNTHPGIYANYSNGVIVYGITSDGNSGNTYRFDSFLDTQYSNNLTLNKLKLSNFPLAILGPMDTSQFIVSNVELFNNTSSNAIAGLRLNNMYLLNSIIYNVSVGLSIVDGDGLFINNLIAYSHKFRPISTSRVNNISINNMLGFNNQMYGLDLGGGTNAFINNFVGVNNYYNGLRVYDVNNTITNNVYALNNNYYGTYPNYGLGDRYNDGIPSNVTYFGKMVSAYSSPQIKVESIDTSYTLGFYTGSGSQYFSNGQYLYNSGSLSSLSANAVAPTGSLDTTIQMSCDWHIQPSNVASWGVNCLDKGQKAITGSSPTFTYGNNIPNQSQPYIFSGGVLVPYGKDKDMFYSTKKIGQ